MDCLSIVIRRCAVCGKEFETKCSKNNTRQTCSRECTKKFAHSQSESSFRKLTKICELCGKEFHPKNNKQVICEREHFRTCIVCGKQFNVNYDSAKGRNDLRLTCSDECYRKNLSEKTCLRKPETREKIKQTVQERYGVDHVMHAPEIVEKQRQSMLDKYGVEHFRQSPLYAERTARTCLERYGCEWYMQSSDFKDKARAALLEKYGVDRVMHSSEITEKMREQYLAKTGYEYPMQNPEVRDKAKQSCIDKYGVENYSQTDEYREKYRKTSLERYGTEFPMQNLEIQKKAANTCLSKYGASNYAQSEEGKKRITAGMIQKYGFKRYSQTLDWKLQTMKKCEHPEEWMKFVDDPETYIKTHYEESPTYHRLERDFGVNAGAVSDVIIRRDLKHLIKPSQSHMEEEIIDLLNNLGVEYIIHDRKSIPGMELDFTIPKYNFSIECNPTATHNSSLPYIDSDSDPLPPKYHQIKTDKAEEVGLTLFHLFGYEWYYKQDIIESMLRSRLGCSQTRIYARKCKVIQLDNSATVKFLNENHRQGGINSPIRLGLIFEGEIVSVMTFGKMRHTIGTGKEDLTDCYELVRFCSLLDTSVVGGASKLLHYFINEYNPARIRSFSDRARASGNVYQKLGFTEIRRSEPGYVWVNTKTNAAVNRVSAQKQNIKNTLKDDTIDLSKTEKQIMLEHGYVQVFDSGTSLWEMIL